MSSEVKMSPKRQMSCPFQMMQSSIASPYLDFMMSLALNEGIYYLY